ncbi:Uncharacterised protein [Mycobacteroides abscessus subsp. abscessus]|nr:Uncharacterised protein [Mycobacteroides abscessus subsp. abscessus]
MKTSPTNPAVQTARNARVTRRWSANRPAMIGATSDMMSATT